MYTLVNSMPLDDASCAGKGDVVFGGVCLTVYLSVHAKMQWSEIDVTG